jgi:hypothetical protein
MVGDQHDIAKTRQVSGSATVRAAGDLDVEIALVVAAPFRRVMVVARSPRRAGSSGKNSQAAIVMSPPSVASGGSASVTSNDRLIGPTQRSSAPIGRENGDCDPLADCGARARLANPSHFEIG